MSAIWLIAGALALACVVLLSHSVMLRIALTLFAWLFLGAAAFAADTTVALLPWYQIAEPYILTAFGIVFSALLAWAIRLFQQKTGIQIDQHWRGVIQQAAQNAAGRVLAQQEGNVAGLRFDVHNSLVKQEVERVQEAVPGALDKLGVTPDRLGNLIVGKIGQLQAGAIATAPAAATPQTARSL